MTRRILALAATLLLAAGCGGSKGAQGATGPQGPAGADGTNGTDGQNGQNGQNGTDTTAIAKPESCEGCHENAGTLHQSLYDTFKNGINPATTKMHATIVGVSTVASATAGKFKSTITVSVNKDGATACLAPSALKQKTMYFVTQDAGGKFVTPPYVQSATDDPTGEKGGAVPGSVENFSFGSMTLVAGSVPPACTYTMVKDGLNADPVAAATNAFVYGYFGDTNLDVPANTNTSAHYALMENMISVAQVLKGAVTYTSTAKASGCEKCHGAPYSKHGYRQAAVAGLADFVACKACHTDSRRGTDGAWYMLVDDPAALAAQDDVLTDAQKAKYAYTANVMQDTHNSHAFEFAYPQSMASCVTCHEGNIAAITANTNFRLSTCRSCHAVTGPAKPDPKRAPPLKTILSTATLAPYHQMDLYAKDVGTDYSCQGCHGNVAFSTAPTFAQIHNGYDAKIYKADGTRYAAGIAASITEAKYDSATKKVTVKFAIAGTAPNAIVKPTVVVSLFGYGTKDFVVSGHSSQFADKTPNLEWSEGATVRNSNPPVSANTDRLTVAPATATAGNAAWTVTADLTTWAAQLADGSVKRVQIAFLPTIGVDQTKAVSTTNPAIAVTGVTKTITLTNGTAPVADAAAIVDPAKCNACHDALATTFHNPNYGSAGVVGCRVCHTVRDGGSHLEMQSRSIDSYVHAIHSFQMMDIKNVDFADPVQKMEYEEHIGSTYPNFMIQNCESCHVTTAAGARPTYDVPDQSKSLPGVLSAASTVTNTTRSIGVVPSAVTGPAGRACGSCHRAQMINEDEAGALAALNGHFATFGTQVPAGTGVLDSVTESLMALFK